MGCSKSGSKRKVYSNTILPQETRKTSNRQPNFTPKTTGKRRTKNSQNQQKERNHKDCCSFIIGLEIRTYQSNFALFQNFSAVLGPLHFRMNFSSSLSISQKENKMWTDFVSSCCSRNCSRFQSLTLHTMIVLLGLPGSFTPSAELSQQACCCCC